MDWQEVGDRVFVRRYRSWNGEPFDQNVGVVAGAEGIVVVDTRGSHRLADELRNELGTLTRQQVVAVINTHHHWDHTWGNARFADSAIWGHVRCAERVANDSEARRRALVEQVPALAGELMEVAFTPPTQTFDERATVDLGDRQVELRHVGRGHTDNDIVVRVEDASVLFAGDLLENHAPPSFGDAFPIAWAETAMRLLPMADGAVVPGHGGVGDRSFAERQAAELAEMAELARQVVAGGIGQEEAVRRSPFPADTTERALQRAAIELEEVPA